MTFFYKKTGGAAERPASANQTKAWSVGKTWPNRPAFTPKVGSWGAPAINTGLTYGAGYGEADEAAHENAIVELIEEVAASGIERQQVLQERVSEQVPIEMARKRHLGFSRKHK